MLKGRVTSISFNPAVKNKQTSLLVAGDDSNTISFWNYVSGELLNKIKYSDPIYSVSLSFDG